MRTANSSVEAIALLQSFQPDILISDIAMPGMDGYTLIQQLRALLALAGGEISAIAITAYAQEEERQRALEAVMMFMPPSPSISNSWCKA